MDQFIHYYAVGIDQSRRNLILSLLLRITPGQKGADTRFFRDEHTGMFYYLFSRGFSCYAAFDISFWVPNRVHIENGNAFLFRWILCGQLLLKDSCLLFVDVMIYLGTHAGCMGLHCHMSLIDLQGFSDLSNMVYAQERQTTWSIFYLTITDAKIIHPLWTCGNSLC
ncbi:hypothetical protein ACJX0J_032124 [Zea mays]